MHLLCIGQKIPHTYSLLIVPLLLISTIIDSHAASYTITPTSRGRGLEALNGKSYVGTGWGNGITGSMTVNDSADE